LYDVWTSSRGAKRILSEADRLTGRRITDVRLGHLRWPAENLTCLEIAQLIIGRDGEVVVTEGPGVAAMATSRWALKLGSSARVTVVRPWETNRRAKRNAQIGAVAAALIRGGWGGPVTEVDLDRTVPSLRRSTRDPFAGRRWSRRGAAWVDRYVLVCDDGSLTDEKVAEIEALDDCGRPDLLAHGVFGHAIPFSDLVGG
jgi:hypothetical protein